jgi:hypothetical protein
MEARTASISISISPPQSRPQSLMVSYWTGCTILCLRGSRLRCLSKPGPKASRSLEAGANANVDARKSADSTSPSLQVHTNSTRPQACSSSSREPLSIFLIWCLFSSDCLIIRSVFNSWPNLALGARKKLEPKRSGCARPCKPSLTLARCIHSTFLAALWPIARWRSQMAAFSGPAHG